MTFIKFRHDQCKNLVCWYCENQSPCSLVSKFLKFELPVLIYICKKCIYVEAKSYVCGLWKYYSKIIYILLDIITTRMQRGDHMLIFHSIGNTCISVLSNHGVRCRVKFHLVSFLLPHIRCPSHRLATINTWGSRLVSRTERDRSQAD